MIWESSDWKEALLESTSRLQKLSKSNEIDESKFVQIEKDVFIGFYAIRKLMDTAKISDSIKSFDVSLKCFPNLKPVDYMNWHRVDELYDLSGKQCAPLSMLIQLERAPELISSIIMATLSQK